MYLQELFETTEQIDNDLIVVAKKHFGLTKNPNEAGYLLPDGAMLDFSGRHESVGNYRLDPQGHWQTKRGEDYRADRRHIDHRDLGGLVADSGTKGMHAFMDATHAVRVMPKVGFQLRHPPTQKQIVTMLAMANFWQEEIHIDSPHRHESLDQPVRPAAFIAAVRRLFPSG